MGFGRERAVHDILSGMLKSIVRRMVRHTGYDIMPRYTIPVDVRQLRTYAYMARSYERVRAVDGAFVECGVGKGRTFLYLSYLASLGEKQRTVWGFDSFEGFPEPRIEDASARQPRAGEWSGTSPDDIRGILRCAGVDSAFVASHTKLVEGFFPQSFAAYDNGPIALLHADVDLYQSYKDVLEKFEPHVVSGGIIMFDEYRVAAWPGATQAIDEYFGDRVRDFSRDRESGKTFYIKP